MIEIPTSIVGLDFETYYASDYSLRQKDISTTEYVRDPRFKAHGISIRKENEKEAKWYRDADISHALNDIDWTKTGMLAHHAHFDGLILSHHYGIVPAFYFCTLSMARPLHGGEITNDLDSVSIYYGGEGKKNKQALDAVKGMRDLPPALMEKLGIYGCDDNNDMWHIFNCMLPHFTPEELALIHYTVRAYADPILKIDRALALSVHQEEIDEKKRLIKKVNNIAPETHLDDKEFLALKKKFNSREPFANRLRALGVEPPKKISPANGKPTYAFAKNDLAFQALEMHPNEQVRDLIEAKLVCSSSIEQTRAIRMMSHCQDPYCLPLYLAYGKAHTFRWAGGDKMNPQNFGRNSKLRNVIVAPDGYTLIIVDSGQIEARVNAWLAGETELVKAFRDDLDIYSEFAAEEVYHVPKETITKKSQERFVGKVCILGLGYQMGASKFQYTLEAGTMGPKVILPEEMYAQAVQKYRSRFKNIVNQWYYFNDRLYDMWNGNEIEYGPIVFDNCSIRLPNGMILKYPNLRPQWNEARGEYGNYRYNQNTKIYGGLLVENIVQALARIIVAEQALRVSDLYRIVLLVHDEVVLCVPEDKAEQALKDTLASFHQPLDWCKDLPVVGEGAISKCYRKL